MELKLLAVAVVVGLVQLFWAAGAARAQQDMKWAAGPRDTPMPITGAAARLERAFWNFAETFPFFAVAILLIDSLNGWREWTVWGAHLYVWSRVLYVPLYAYGSRFRSLVWIASLLGLLIVVAALFI